MVFLWSFSTGMFVGCMLLHVRGTGILRGTYRLEWPAPCAPSVGLLSELGS